ncbi:DUF2505 domain-containing protein [Humibacillus xanthopallidus]|uniref:Uncharacterized protein DUF2505 n=1 Tax=Humibacillus xanthopallidus TaxID=412689 RepID=A0A543HVI3_9MICO|nr:DUF2505 domain-containing protein [Humibacillus xanthopallidus]TQM62358.1 uncharacterized protein DUF2505 [Humibacillus xanthopallidus]
MKITERIDYAAAPAAVFAMLTDTDFQVAKCIEAGSERHESAVTPAGDGARVVTQRDLPAHHLPDFARSIVGDTLSVTETYDWSAPASDGGRDGTLVVEVAGAPVALRAKVRLVPSASSTAMTIDGDLKASIPLLGGKVEKAAAPAVVDAIHLEGRTGARWLADRV